MKHRIWEGPLPKYWVESPWWVRCNNDIILATPEVNGQNLRRLTSRGETVWERHIVGNVLMFYGDGVVITARVRDGRSHAVYSQFTAFDEDSGQLLWEIPEAKPVLFPKGALPHIPSCRDPVLFIKLDDWRSVQDGRLHCKVISLDLGREDWRYGATVITKVPSGLLVQSGTAEWKLPNVDFRCVLGVVDQWIVGCEPHTALWARNRQTGQLAWRLTYDSDRVVVPSEGVAGLDAECWNYAETVPVVAVVRNEQIFVLQEDPPLTRLVSWPAQAEVERWNSTGAVVLLGQFNDGILALEELEDGMGYLWFIR